MSYQNNDLQRMCQHVNQAIREIERQTEPVRQVIKHIATQVEPLCRQCIEMHGLVGREIERALQQTRINTERRREPEVTEVVILRSKYDEVIQAKDTEIREKDRIIAELIDMIPEIEEPSG